MGSLPVSEVQHELLKALKLRNSRFYFLPGDTVQLTLLAAFCLESFVEKLGLSSPEIAKETLQNLRNGNLTTTDLMSPSLTGDRLKSLGIPLGPRKAILEFRDNAKSTFKIISIRQNGTFEIKNDTSETKDAHYTQLSFVENGKVASSLEELGFVEREIISRALISLKLEAFDAGLDTTDGQRIIDSLTSSSDTGKDGTLFGSEETKEDSKARQNVEDYIKLFAALKSMRLQKPFPAAFEDSVKLAFDAPKEGEATWTWGSHEQTDISITEEGWKATKNYVTGPDYSCAVGSEAFDEGIHTWEIEVNNTKQTSYSMWLGIARGIEEGQLGQYPSNGICEYMIALGCGGGDLRLSGKQPTIENVSSYQYQSGQRVKFELDMNEHTLQISIDGALALIARDVDDQGVRPYVCMDYSESAFILSRTCTRRKSAEEESKLPVSAISADDVSAALDNSLWTEELDSALVRLPFAGIFILLHLRNEIYEVKFFSFR